MAATSADLGTDGTTVAEPRDLRRRRQLIDATITSISENGLSGTTVAKVAEIAGLSTGIVSFYFQSKNALLLSTLEHVDGELERRQREATRLAGDDPVRRLDAMIDVEFDPDVCNPRWTAVWDAFWGEARARDDYMRVCGRREAAQERQVVEIFRAIVEAGGHHHLHAEALGSAFYHLLTSLPENVLETHESFDFEEAKKTCRQFLTSIFPDEFSDEALSAKRPRVEVDGATSAKNVDSTALPSWVYCDSEFYELEVEHLFRRSWILVGHTSEAPETGDYITLDVANDRVFAIRGADGKLRAFDNVCRHRASRVVAGEAGSCSQSIVCPYHGWSYDYDGQLRDVPAEATFSGMDKANVALQELQLEEWMGFVFIRLSGDGPSVSEQLAGIHDEASLYHFEEMKPWHDRTTIDCDFNWKLFAESYANGDHIPVGHPGLPRLFGGSDSEHVANDIAGSDASRSLAVLQETESSAWSERMYQRLLPEVETLPPELRHSWVYYAIFPTTVLRISPDLVAGYQVIPNGPDQCRIREFTIARDDQRREMRAARYLASRIARQAIKKSLDFCSGTYVGTQSSRYPGALLSKHETGVIQFHDRIRERLPVATLPERPAPGRVTDRNRDLTSRR